MPQLPSCVYKKKKIEWRKEFKILLIFRILENDSKSTLAFIYKKKKENGRIGIISKVDVPLILP